MTGDVEQLPKNIRYKLLMVRGDYYLLDMDRNPLLFIFPFLNWFFTHEIIQVDSQNVERMKEEKRIDKVPLIASMLGAGGLSVSLGNLTDPMIQKLEIGTPMPVNIIIFLIVLVPILYLRVWMKKRNKRKVGDFVSFEEEEKLLVKVKPQPRIHMLLFVLLYLALWIFVIGGTGFFFVYGHFFMLLAGVLCLFFIFLINNQIIRPGKAEITVLE